MNDNLKPMEREEPNLSNVKLDQEPNIENVNLDEDSIIRKHTKTIVNADKNNESN